MKSAVMQLAQYRDGWQRRLLLVIFASALVLPFALGPTMNPTAEAASSWPGVRKGIEWTGNGWNRESYHYVEFNVNACMRSDSWRVSGPRSPEF